MRLLLAAVAPAETAVLAAVALAAAAAGNNIDHFAGSAADNRFAADSVPDSPAVDTPENKDSDSPAADSLADRNRYRNRLFFWEPRHMRCPC